MPAPPAVIESTVPLPAPAGQEAAPPATVATQADLRREYIASGGWPWLSLLRARALATWVDEPSRDNPAVYDDMMTDPQVSSTVNLRRLAVLAQGWTLTVPKGLENDPLAEEIRAFCETCFTHLNTPLSRVLFELMGALVHGYAPAEQLYAYDADGRLALTDIKPKAVGDVVLYVDAFGNELGYRPVAPGQSIVWGAPWNPDLKDANDQPVTLYDRRKLVVHKHQPTARRLLGQSALRPAWEDWWFKRQLDPEHLKFVVQFASPTLHGKVDPAAKPYKERDPLTGLPLPNGRMVYPEQVLADALAGVHNSSYIVTTGNDAVDPIAVTSDGNVFLLAYNHKDRAITKAVLYQTLATEEAEHMARAASDTHQDVLDLVFSWDKEGLETTVRDECLYHLVAYNWGIEAAETYTPTFTLPRVAHQDTSELWRAAASLGFRVHRSQLPGLDSELGLPARDMAAQEADDAAAQDAAARIAAQPPPAQADAPPPEDQSNE